VSRLHHHRLNHSTHFAEGKNHIKGQEHFWNQARRVPRKYHGLHQASFPLCLDPNVNFDLMMVRQSNNSRYDEIGAKTNP